MQEELSQDLTMERIKDENDHLIKEIEATKSELLQEDEITAISRIVSEKLKTKPKNLQRQINHRLFWLINQRIKNETNIDNELEGIIPSGDYFTPQNISDEKDITWISAKRTPLLHKLTKLLPNLTNAYFINLDRILLTEYGNDPIQSIQLVLKGRIHTQLYTLFHEKLHQLQYLQLLERYKKEKNWIPTFIARIFLGNAMHQEVHSHVGERLLIGKVLEKQVYQPLLNKLGKDSPYGFQNEEKIREMESLITTLRALGVSHKIIAEIITRKDAVSDIKTLIRAKQDEGKISEEALDLLIKKYTLKNNLRSLQIIKICQDVISGFAY